MLEGAPKVAFYQARALPVAREDVHTQGIADVMWTPTKMVAAISVNAPEEDRHLFKWKSGNKLQWGEDPKSLITQR